MKIIVAIIALIVIIIVAIKSQASVSDPTDSSDVSASGIDADTTQDFPVDLNAANDVTSDDSYFAAIGVSEDMTLTKEQITPFAMAAGFSGNDLDVAVSIALAESGGKTDAYNPEVAAKGGTPDGYGSFGLWQIYLKMHPEFTGWDLKDPQQNANAAYSVWRKSGFKPWSTFNTYDANGKLVSRGTGAYLKYMNA